MPLNVAFLADGFLSAALGNTTWEAAMDAAAGATGGVGAILLALKGNLPSIPFSQSLGALTEVYFRDGWVERDERFRGVPALVRRGVITDLDVMPADQIAQHPYYMDFLAQAGLRWFAGIKVAAGDDLWCLSIQRTIGQGPFSTEEQEILADVSARLSGAAAVARALGFARAEVALAAFEASGTPVALLDRCGEVFALNRSAESLLGPDLKIAARRLASWNCDATASLDRAIYNLVWDKEGPSCGLPVILPRLVGRPIIAYPTRLSGLTNEYFAAARSIVIFQDLARKFVAPEAMLCRIFKLTPSEASLATLIGSGETIERAANQLGICYETARSVIKVVLHKTETHRQSELVSLLLRLATASPAQNEPNYQRTPA